MNKKKNNLLILLICRREKICSKFAQFAQSLLKFAQSLLKFAQVCSEFAQVCSEFAQSLLKNLSNDFAPGFAQKNLCFKESCCLC